jgi:hypothetical protein
VCFAITTWAAGCIESSSVLGGGFFRQPAQIIIARLVRPVPSARRGRRIRLAGARGHDFLHHHDKSLLLGLPETFQRLMMRRAR